MTPTGLAVSRTAASKLDRFVGAFIDGIILLPLALLYLIPVIGWIAFAGIGAAWWLLRDAKGISIGKKVMNLEVVSKDGSPATQDQLMKRNFTLAGAAACNVIPIIGGMVGGAINLVECILMLVKDERYGDQMANTMVVKKG